MKIFSMPRGHGKTTLLIVISHFTNARIITATMQSAKSVEELAKRMNLSIPTPMDCTTFLQGEERGYKENKILIDELDWVLKRIFPNNEILAVTRTEESIKM